MARAARRDRGGAGRLAPFALEASLPGVPLYRRVGYLERARYGLAMPDGSTLPVSRMAKARGAAAVANQ